VSRRIPKYRSDLAYGAGFTALTFLFGYAIVDVIFDLVRSGAISQTTFLIALPLPRLPAPFAFWLGISAWSDLKRFKSGKLPVALGLIIGFLGTPILLFESYQVARALWFLSQD
jgi:hypothetical protein